VTEPSKVVDMHPAKRRLKQLWLFTVAVFSFLTFKVIYFYCEIDGLKYKYGISKQIRWYSPLAWLVLIVVCCIMFWMDGLRELFRELSGVFSKPVKASKTGYGTYAQDFSLRKKKLMLWITIHTT